MTFEPLAPASTVRWNLRGEPTYDVARAEKERGALTVPAGDDTRATGRIAPVVAVPATSRRRRPSGEPPPLPRTVDVRSRLLWGAVGLAAVLSIAFLASDVLNGVTRLDLAVSRALDRIKWEPLTQTLSTYSKFLGSSVTVAVIAWSTLIAILVLRQFRHLIVYAALLLGVSVVASALASGSDACVLPTSHSSSDGTDTRSLLEASSHWVSCSRGSCSHSSLPAPGDGEPHSSRSVRSLSSRSHACTSASIT